MGKPETPSLLVELGRGGELRGLPVAVFVIGLLFTAYLVARRVRGALLIGILGTTVIAIAMNELIAGGNGWPDTMPGAARLPERLVAFPAAENFSLIGDFSFGYIGRLGAIAAILAVFTIMLSDFFDTMGTVVGLGAKAGYLDADGRLPRSRQVLLVDSAAAAVGGAFSASSNTTYIESASGICRGWQDRPHGHRGRPAVRWFRCSCGRWPTCIPPQATAPALIIVGLPDDGDDPGDPVRALRAGHPRISDHGRDAVHLLDHQRGGRRLRELHGHQAGAGRSPGRPLDDVRLQRRLRASTSASTT